MPEEIHRRLPAGPRERRVLRAAVALGAATMMLCAFGQSVAAADSSAPPNTAGAFTAVDNTADIAAIKQLKTTYFADIDAKNWSGLRDLLDPLVYIDTTGSAGPILVGRDPFISFLQLTLGSATTHHQGFDPAITLHSATSADVVWRMEDVLHWGTTFGIHGYGHYYDHYEKVNGSWIIQSSKLTRDRIDLINPDGSVIQPNMALADVTALFHQATGL